MHYDIEFQQFEIQWVFANKVKPATLSKKRIEEEVIVISFFFCRLTCKRAPAGGRGSPRAPELVADAVIGAGGVAHGQWDVSQADRPTPVVAAR